MSPKAAAESVAENIWTILVARIAMISTPYVATVLIFLGQFWSE